MIVIAINPFLSHFIPTISIAHRLQAENHEVVYLGFEKSRVWVENENFLFVALSSYQDTDLKIFKRKGLYYQLRKAYLCLHEEIYKFLVETKNITLVIFPISRFNTFFIPIYKAEIRTVMYSVSSGAAYANLTIPPCTSSFIPKYKKDVRVAFLWLRRLVRKTNIKKLMILPNSYPYKELINIAKREKFRWKFTIDGFCFDLPLVKFGPKELEFKFHEDVHYGGLCVKECGFSEPEILKTCQKIVYCSFGTMSYRYLGIREYLQGLIDIFAKHQEWQLIISLGDEKFKNEFVNYPKNVSVYSFVNQQAILSKADLAIIHGGYGTIKECIYYEVPMIISPSSYDQHGNAARVLFHGIGVRNNLLKKNIIERLTKRKFGYRNYDYLESQITEVLINKKYLIEIRKMKNKIDNDQDFEKLIDLLTQDEW